MTGASPCVLAALPAPNLFPAVAGHSVGIRYAAGIDLSLCETGNELPSCENLSTDSHTFSKLE
jgi:hypothetical protein